MDERSRRRAALLALRGRRQGRLSDELLRFNCLWALIVLAVVAVLGILAIVCLWALATNLPVAS